MVLHVRTSHSSEEVSIVTEGQLILVIVEISRNDGFDSVVERLQEGIFGKLIEGNVSPLDPFLRVCVPIRAEKNIVLGGIIVSLRNEWTVTIGLAGCIGMVIVKGNSVKTPIVVSLEFFRRAIYGFIFFVTILLETRTISIE
ncbi:hypothetical protein DU484_13980 [Haloplanus rubicundus]|uniref:Uncharacterized protein n=1 Tax=Haloplanus rubicundus TaxID=1547898 RepID=A0A345EF92_9EURY|nr:hypothetical protein DU484_13980 [Haloplanus rubicundus]